MPDSWIKKMSKEKNMIEPFADEQNKNGVISYGVSSYGYDARVSDEFKVFTNVNNALVDPKNFSEASFIDDLGADSLDTVELVMALEEEFDIEIPDEEEIEEKDGKKISKISGSSTDSLKVSLRRNNAAA